jgi:hypothetical protein
MAVWSVIKLSALSGAFRLDPEFWRPEYLRVERAIKKTEYKRLGDLALSLRKGVFHILAESYVDQGVPFYRSSNVGAIVPKESDLVFITPQRHKEECKTALFRGDIMLAKTGKEAASVVLVKECNVSQDVVALRPDREKINPFFLAVFLNTDLGALQMRRWFQGQVQMHLSLPDTRQILVPMLTRKQQDSMEALVIASEAQIALAHRAFTAAEARLMESLRMDNVDLTPDKCYSRRFCELRADKRFDAERFNPKYDRLLNAIRGAGDAPLGEHLDAPIRRGIQPQYVINGDMIVINSQHVRRDEIRLDDNRTTSSSFNGLVKGQVAPGDVLLNSTGYITIGRSQPIIDPLNVVVDSHIAILRPSRNLDPVFLSVFLNSPAGYLQTERSWTGSSGQIELRTEEIAGYRIWLPPMSEQLKIRKLYESGLSHRRDAAKLLEKAKRQVELLIARRAQR